MRRTVTLLHRSTAIVAAIVAALGPLGQSLGIAKPSQSSVQKAKSAGKVLPPTAEQIRQLQVKVAKVTRRGRAGSGYVRPAYMTHVKAYARCS